VATTGEGEEIIRRMSAMRVYRMLEAGMEAEEACRTEVASYSDDAVFGVIAMDAGGMGTDNNRTMPTAALTG
jgi:isoaspartyl peptidase/L-asparaginase-like protein (Ntn-hydrolase superfamily)